MESPEKFLSPKKLVFRVSKSPWIWSFLDQKSRWSCVKLIVGTLQIISCYCIGHFTSLSASYVGITIAVNILKRHAQKHWLVLACSTLRDEKRLLYSTHVHTLWCLYRHLCSWPVGCDYFQSLLRFGLICVFQLEFSRPIVLSLLIFMYVLQWSVKWSKPVTEWAQQWLCYSNVMMLDHILISSSCWTTEVSSSVLLLYIVFSIDFSIFIVYHFHHLLCL